MRAEAGDDKKSNTRKYVEAASKLYNAEKQKKGGRNEFLKTFLFYIIITKQWTLARRSLKSFSQFEKKNNFSDETGRRKKRKS